MKHKVLVDLRVVCDPPELIGGWSRTLEDKARRLEGWCREFEQFVRDHRSQDPISLSVERKYQDQCGFCGRVWEEDADGPLCCSDAQREWEWEKQRADVDTADYGAPMILYGADALRKWLKSQGFRCELSARYLDNGCNWYAYRRSELSARACECNDDKPGMQIVVKPNEITLRDNLHRSVEIELRGEANGVWWQITAYSIGPEEVPSKLSDIERALVSAWNALRP